VVKRKWKLQFPLDTPGKTSIGITAIADTFKTRYRYQLLPIDMDGNIARDVGNSLLAISLSIIGDIFREYR